MLHLPLAVALMANTLSWKDDKSGREYLLIDTEMTHSQAEHTCLEQGYALSDLRYLNDDERKAFLASSFLDQSLPWETLFPGTSRETRITKIWQGAQISVMGFASSLATIQKRGDKVTIAEEWKGDDDKARAVCMSTDAFWYWCSVHYKCTIKYTGGEFSEVTTYADTGATENEAMRRIVERTQDPANSGEGRCAIDTETHICYRQLPDHQ
jgi:hypothetical protein